MCHRILPSISRLPLEPQYLRPETSGYSLNAAANALAVMALFPGRGPSTVYSRYSPPMVSRPPRVLSHIRKASDKLSSHTPIKSRMPRESQDVRQYFSNLCCCKGSNPSALCEACAQRLKDSKSTGSSPLPSSMSLIILFLSCSEIFKGPPV